MGYKAYTYSEYDISCDICGRDAVLHSSDVIDGKRVNSSNVIKLAGYHRHKGMIVCDNCLKRIKRS